MIEKTIRFPFMGGYLQLVPPGTMVDENGTEIAYAASVKVVGISRFPIKLSRACIEAIVFNMENSTTFSDFVQEIA